MSKTKMPASRMRPEVRNAAKTTGVLLSSAAALVFSSPKGYGMENFNSLSPIANLFYSNEIAAIDKYNGSYVQVNGKIGKIDSREGVIVVWSGDYYLLCQYAKRDHSNVLILEKGGGISVQGSLNITVSGSSDPVFSISKCRVLGPYSTDTRDISPKKLNKRELEEKRFQKILENF